MAVLSGDFIESKDDKVLDWTKQAIEESRMARFKNVGNLTDEWDMAEKTYLNIDKSRTGKNVFNQAPRENMFFLVVELQKYTLMDNVPDPLFASRFPNRFEDEAFILNDLQDLSFEAGRFPMEYSRYIHDLLVLGTGIFRIWFDVKGFGGKGIASYKSVDPRSFFLSAGARVIEESSYCIQVSEIDVDEALARFPDKKDDIKNLSGDTIITKSNDTKSFFRGMFRSADKDSGRGVELVDVFVRDRGDGEIYHSIVLGGKVVAKNPTPLGFNHGMYPFVSSQGRYNPNGFYGWMDYIYVDSVQRELDRLNDKRNAYTELSYFPYLLVPQGSGADMTDDKLAQKPGSIIRPTLSSSNTIRFLSPPPVGRHIQSRRLEAQDWIKKVVGTGQLSEQALQKNLQPTTVSQVVQAFEAPVRYKLRLMEPAIRDLALQSSSLMTQFFDEEIIVRFSDEDTATIDKERFREISDIGEEQFIVKVGVPSHIPLNTAFRVSRVVDAVKNGAYNRELPIEARKSLMNAFGVPERKELIKKESQRAELQEAIDLLNMEISVKDLTLKNSQLDQALAQSGTQPPPELGSVQDDSLGNQTSQQLPAPGPDTGQQDQGVSNNIELLQNSGLQGSV